MYEYKGMNMEEFQPLKQLQTPIFQLLKNIIKGGPNFDIIPNLYKKKVDSTLRHKPNIFSIDNVMSICLIFI